MTLLIIHCITFGFNGGLGVFDGNGFDALFDALFDGNCNGGDTGGFGSLGFGLYCVGTDNACIFIQFGTDNCGTCPVGINAANISVGDGLVTLPSGDILAFGILS